MNIIFKSKAIVALAILLELAFLQIDALPIGREAIFKIPAIKKAQSSTIRKSLKQVSPQTLQTQRQQLGLQQNFKTGLTGQDIFTSYQLEKSAYPSLVKETVEDISEVNTETKSKSPSTAFPSGVERVFISDYITRTHSKSVNRAFVDVYPSTTFTQNSEIKSHHQHRGRYQAAPTLHPLPLRAGDTERDVYSKTSVYKTRRGVRERKMRRYPFHVKVTEISAPTNEKLDSFRQFADKLVIISSRIQKVIFKASEGLAESTKKSVFTVPRPQAKRYVKVKGDRRLNRHKNMDVNKPVAGETNTVNTAPTKAKNLVWNESSAMTETPERKEFRGKHTTMPRTTDTILFVADEDDFY